MVGSDKGFFGGEELSLDMEDLSHEDFVEDLHGGPLAEDPDTLFGRFRVERIEALFRESGVMGRLHDMGYGQTVTEFQRLSGKDQRIIIREGEEKLIHMRLKLSLFEFRLHPGVSRKRLLYIDWLETRHPRCDPGKIHDLFPGQKYPGLGIFTQISSFFLSLALELRVAAIFNMPEYFHDALLFHRKFGFYDPVREAVFRALVRDLRHQGARRISRLIGEGRVVDAGGETLVWRPAEMISPVQPDLARTIWDETYEKSVARTLASLSYRVI